MFQKLSAPFKACSLLDLSKIREIKHLFSRGSLIDEEIGRFEILLSVKRHIFHLSVNQQPVLDAVKWFKYLSCYDYFSTHIKTQSGIPFSPPYAASDRSWSGLVHSHYFKRLQSAQIRHYVILHNTTPADRKKTPLIRCLATCRFSSHLVARHCHIPARPNSTNQRLPPNQLWRKGQRPSRQTESNGRDESAPIAPLAEWKSQGGSRRPNRQWHLSGDLLPPRIKRTQSKCQSPHPAGRLGCGKAGLEGAW